MIFGIEFEEKENFDVEFDEQESSFSTDFASNIIFPQRNPGSAENGATFYPSVSPEGILSWTNDKGLPNPTPVNIKGADGEKGEKGDPYTLTEADKASITQSVIASLPKYNGEVIEL